MTNIPHFMPSLLDTNPHRVDRDIMRQPYRADDFPLGEADCRAAVEVLIHNSHGVSVVTGWHHDHRTGEVIDHNVGERMVLMISEICEAMEADRKSLMDDKLPHRIGVEVELADAIHRIFDFAGKHGLDLGGAYVEKALFNLTREDHKAEVRAKAGGKAY